MKTQKGMTLVELMVGLTISLIVILAMFTLYRYAVRNIFGSCGTSCSDNPEKRGLVANARQDGELATALLTIQNRLQSAGFGFSATVANHFVLVSGASLSATNTVSTSAAQSVGATSVSGNAVFWESNPDLAGSTDSYRCSGILSDTSTKAVYLLEKAGSCHPVSTTWSSVQWSKTTLIAANVLASQLTFSASTSSTCNPFGLDALKVASSSSGSSSSANSSSTSSTVVVTPTPVPNAGLHVLINYSNSTTNSSNSYSVCLQNYPS